MGEPSVDRNVLLKRGLLPLSSSNIDDIKWIGSPVVWSPDSSMIVAIDNEENMRVIDVKSREIVKVLSIPNVTWVAWSPNNTYIAFSSCDRSIWLLAVGSWRLQKLSGHMGWVMSVAWSPDSCILASVSHDGTLRLWDMCCGKKPETVRTIKCCSCWVMCVAWSPDGAIIASASDNGTVQLWAAEDGSLVQSFEDGEDLVRCLAWSPDGSTIVSASDDTTIRMFDAISGSMLRQLKGHCDWVYSVAWSPDGSTLVSGSTDGSIRFWDGETGDMLRTIQLVVDTFVYSVSWSPDGRTIVAGNIDAAIMLLHV